MKPIDILRVLDDFQKAAQAGAPVSCLAEVYRDLPPADLARNAPSTRQWVAEQMLMVINGLHAENSRVDGAITGLSTYRPAPQGSVGAQIAPQSESTPAQAVSDSSGSSETGSRLKRGPRR